MKSRIFLSYASSLGEAAARIELSLKGEGYAVFRDRTALPPGESFDARIRAAVEESDLFVFLISPESVTPGRYCGFSLTGSGVCLDATRDAWVTRVRFEVNLRCFEPQVTTFKFEYIYAGSLTLRPDLTFAGSLSNVPLAGGGSLRFSVSGKFDDAERRVAGTGGISKVTVVRDGTRYRCRNAVSSFTAKHGA